MKNVFELRTPLRLAMEPFHKLDVWFTAPFPDSQSSLKLLEEAEVDFLTMLVVFISGPRAVLRSICSRCRYLETARLQAYAEILDNYTLHLSPHSLSSNLFRVPFRTSELYQLSLNSLIGCVLIVKTFPQHRVTQS
jgi:hypothetical protein